MAHEITINAQGQAEMAYAGEKPWHGLGTALSGLATSAEMIDAAHLGWGVSKRELITVDGVNIKSHMATVRDDNNENLGVVGKDYTVVQNHETFAFYESVVGISSAMFETAGSLFGGKRVFMVAKTPNVIRVNNDDITETYLTLFNSFDGSTCLKMFYTPIRVVCNNTLMAAMRGMKNCISIRHMGNMESKIAEARAVLGFANEYHTQYQETCQYLASKVMTTAMIDKFLSDCFKPVSVDADKETSKITQAKIADAKALLDDPKNLICGMSGTAWAAYNAVAEYVDHSSSYKSNDQRMASTMLGTGADMKQKAFDLIMKA